MCIRGDADDADDDDEAVLPSAAVTDCVTLAPSTTHNSIHYIINGTNSAIT